jgi:hypothetical protein
VRRAAEWEVGESGASGKDGQSPHEHAFAGVVHARLPSRSQVLHEGGHRHTGTASIDFTMSRDHAADLAQADHQVGHRAERADGGDGIEARVRKGQRACVHLREVERPGIGRDARSGALEHPVAHVDHGDAQAGRKVLEVVAGSGGQHETAPAHAREEASLRSSKAGLVAARGPVVRATRAVPARLQAARAHGDALTTRS